MYFKLAPLIQKINIKKTSSEESQDIKPTFTTPTEFLSYEPT